MTGSPGIVTGCRAPPRPAESTSATLQMEQERRLRIEYRHPQSRHGKLSSGDLDTFEPGGLLLGQTQAAFVERQLLEPVSAVEIEPGDADRADGQPS